MAIEFFDPFFDAKLASKVKTFRILIRAIFILGTINI